MATNEQLEQDVEIQRLALVELRRELQAANEDAERLAESLRNFRFFVDEEKWPTMDRVMKAHKARVA